MQATNSIRNEFNEFLDDYGLSAKHVSRVLKWDYTTIIKYKNGKEKVSEKREQELAAFIKQYKEALKLLK